jgi:hypothetical protein
MAPAILSSSALLFGPRRGSGVGDEHRAAVQTQRTLNHLTALAADHWSEATRLLAQLPTTRQTDGLRALAQTLLDVGDGDRIADELAATLAAGYPLDQQLFGLPLSPLLVSAERPLARALIERIILAIVPSPSRPFQTSQDDAAWHGLARAVALGQSAHVDVLLAALIPDDDQDQSMHSCCPKCAARFAGYPSTAQRPPCCFILAQRQRITARVVDLARKKLTSTGWQSSELLILAKSATDEILIEDTVNGLLVNPYCSSASYERRGSTWL